jgi:hypothetical protein
MMAKKITIYVVFGRTGEYSDAQEWTVCAFRNEEKAKELVENATRRAKEIEVSRPSDYHNPIGGNEYDPHMLMDYTGTTYTYGPVELR